MVDLPHGAGESPDVKHVSVVVSFCLDFSYFSVCFFLHLVPVFCIVDIQLILYGCGSGSCLAFMNVSVLSSFLVFAVLVLVLSQLQSLFCYSWFSSLHFSDFNY